MLAQKALYRKMMDALKDAGMWLDWSDQLRNENPKIAKFLCESAKERLEKDFPNTWTHFKEICSEKDACLNEMVEDHILDWYEGMLSRIKRWQ